MEGLFREHSGNIQGIFRERSVGVCQLGPAAFSCRNVPDVGVNTLVVLLWTHSAVKDATNPAVPEAYWEMPLAGFSNAKVSV
jgi:hypothetical protein